MAKQKTLQTLPKTAALCAQWVRCGKPGCRCARGELHGPYHYLFRRERGRLVKRYVRCADVAEVSRELAQGRAGRRRFHEGWATYRRARELLREVLL